VSEVKRECGWQRDEQGKVYVCYCAFYNGGAPGPCQVSMTVEEFLDGGPELAAAPSGEPGEP
jgi:hypothetical protein